MEELDRDGVLVITFLSVGCGKAVAHLTTCGGGMTPGNPMVESLL